MVLISHRGNIDGPNPELENKPMYVLEALNKKYGVEVDVWFDAGCWWLGHDKPEYKVEDSFIFLTPNLWVHCKNADALVALSVSRMNSLITPMFFWHESDTHALVSNGVLWTFPGKPLTEISICVKPEIASYSEKDLRGCLGICSDWIGKYKHLSL